ncbi:hypothetical protein ACFL2R_00910 [Patescibacteria group bacterium]
MAIKIKKEVIIIASILLLIFIGVLIKSVGVANKKSNERSEVVSGEGGYYNDSRVGFKMTYLQNWQVKNYSIAPKEEQQYEFCKNSSDWCGIEIVRDNYYKDDLNNLSLVDYLKKHFGFIATKYTPGSGGVTREELGLRAISEEEFNELIQDAELLNIDGTEVLKIKGSSFYRVGFEGAFDADAVVSRYDQIIFIKNGNIVFITDSVGNKESREIMNSLQFN